MVDLTFSKKHMKNVTLMTLKLALNLEVMREHPINSAEPVKTSIDQTPAPGEAFRSSKLKHLARSFEGAKLKHLARRFEAAKLKQLVRRFKAAKLKLLARRFKAAKLKHPARRFRTVI
nr:hypothetical protein BgiMline_016477 [Biomphalaria glabrata]